MTTVLTLDRGDVRKIKKYLHIVKEEPSKTFPDKVDIVAMAETGAAFFIAGREVPFNQPRRRA